MDDTASLAFDLPLAPAGSAEPLPSAGKAMPTPSDLDLIDRVARRDAEAFAVLYARHSRPVFGMLVRLAGPARARRGVAAGDVHARLAGRRDPRRRARRGARLDLPRSRSTPPAASWPASAAGRPTCSLEQARRSTCADASAGRAAARGRARRRAPGARASPARSSACRTSCARWCVLRCSRELSFAEIAAVTGAPEGTLKSRFHRAVAALRAALGGTGRDGR